MYRDCEGRNKTLFVHRWHDRLCRKFKRINNNNKKPLLELISDYSKVARYKVSIQKSVSFLYTISEQAEFDIRNIITFILASLKVKYLGINLRKSKNHIRKAIRWKKPKKISCSWIARLNTVNMSVFPNLTYRLNAIPIPESVLWILTN